uniref:Glycosyltransferase WbuB n=1 Tax=Anaerolinea thermolimosa TaxID=229919 RepID=A0A7C4KGQ0_9CHLR
MNIAVYSHYFTPEIGAPSARIHDLAKIWVKAGHAVDVITCFPNHPTGRMYPGYTLGWYMKEKLDDICVHRHRTYITPNSGIFKKTLGHISYLPSALMLSNRRVGRPDVVIGTSPTFFAAMAAAFTSMQRNAPFIMEIRDLWPAIFVELGVLRNPQLIRSLEMLELWLYHRATKLVTVTEAFRKNLIERGIAPEKIHNIPNGADPDFWTPASEISPLRMELGLENRFVVLYIGAHGISHALFRLLEAADRLKNTPEIRFVFVGDGAEKTALMAKANELGLNNVLFHNSVDKFGVRNFYGLADVCLVPLRKIPLFDAFLPSKMFEIMAMERPIIGSVRGEAAEILNRSHAAVVVEPEDSAAIAEAVHYLYLHKEKAEMMGKQGRKFVIKQYSRAVLAEKYEHVMHEAIEEHQRRKR